MAVIKILEMKQKRRMKERPLLPEAVGGARIKLCATGCSHCSAMRENTKAAVKELGLESELECISDLAVIARLGVMATPSLIVDGRLVSSGKVLKPEQIKALLNEIMNGQQAPSIVKGLRNEELN
ncbi:MAG: thioredoxin family protein [Clostridia bacterium]|nr:thioredoxin family protein [Clostridia bacterium]MBR6109670.1 thioredoxin family protein [Clostridia bacterium]